jgi:hypothetical protein
MGIIVTVLSEQSRTDHAKGVKITMTVVTNIIFGGFPNSRDSG